MTTLLEAFVLVQKAEIEKLKTRVERRNRAIERQNKEIEKQMDMGDDDYMFKQCFGCNLYVSESGRKYCDFCSNIVCAICPTSYECRNCDIDWCGQCVTNLSNYQAQNEFTGKNMSKFCNTCKQIVGVDSL